MSIIHVHACNGQAYIYNKISAQMCEYIYIYPMRKNIIRQKNKYYTENDSRGYLFSFDMSKTGELLNVTVCGGFFG